MDPTNPAQAAAWAATAEYLDGRIQGHPDQKPGRTPDLAEGAAAAMRAVLHEVGSTPIGESPLTDAAKWAMLEQMVDGDEAFSSQADGVAAAHSHSTRMAAAKKLISNHENVLKDVTNPSPDTNIEGVPLAHKP